MKLFVKISPVQLKSMLFMVVLISLLTHGANAQSKRSVACKLASDLKSGTLVVVLKTDSKKLMWLKKYATSGSEKSKSKFSKQLNKTLANRDSTWKYVTMGFSKLYRFSEVCFLMDTSLQQFIKDPSACSFYDEKLQKLNKMPGGKLFVCKYGHTFEDQSTNLQHAWYVMDSKLGRLQKPFPEIIQFSLFKPSLFLRLPKDFMTENKIDKVGERQRPLQHALKLNNELNKFYSKTGDCA